MTLTGGEVLSRPDFAVIYRELSRMGFHLTVFTNGTLVSPKIIELFTQYPPSKVSITLYGASEETYSRVTGNGKAFQQTLNGIDALLEAGITVELKTTIIKGNVDDFDNIDRLADNRGLQLLVGTYITPRREQGLSDPFANRLTPKEKALFEQHLHEVLSEKNKNTNEYAIDPDSGILEDMPGSDNKKAFHCLAGKCIFWLTWDGRLIPCGDLSVPAEFPLKSGFVPAWEKMIRQVSQIPACMECESCSDRKLCKICPAKRLQETGDVLRKAPYFCEYVLEKHKLYDMAVIH